MNLQRTLKIGLVPMPNTKADFLKAFTLKVMFQNQGPEDVFVESVSVTFQTNYNVPVSERCHVQQGSSLVIPSDHIDYENVEVMPRLIWLPYTNSLSIGARVR